ncbi:MAG: right-handed parallel beta-helix repeat-containing protein [Clostridium sp.]|uniref:right-handed parallel beta-helix repeat-containing protein n=1 Tax=Clostridium sp. TaxID=1506 RepID=UPI003D6CFD02
MGFLKNKITIITIILLVTIISIFTVITINKQKDSDFQNVNRSDIKKYSLDITGDTDTSAGFQKMVDSYPSGSTIELPEGEYLLNATINLKDGISLTSDADVIIRGTGKNTLFSAGNDNTFHGLEFQNCGTAINVTAKKGLKVSDCRFTNKIDFAAINFSGSSDSSITNSFFYDILKYGVLIDNDSSNITIDKNKFDNAKVFGGYAKEQISGHVYSLNGSNIKVTNNILNNSGGQGVIFAYNSTTGKGTTNSVASNNHAEGNGQEGATIYGGDKKASSGNSLIGNTCKNNRFNQIEVWQTDNNIVKNNTVEESLPGIGNLGAICLYDTTGTTVSGNKVLSAQTNGIDITSGSYKCTIINNDIRNTNGKNDTNKSEVGNGILLDSNGKSQPQYITIKNNKISSSNGVIAKSGIYSTANTNQHNEINNNTISGYETSLHEYAKMTIGK